MIKFAPCYERYDPAIWKLLAEVEAQRQSIQRLPVPPRVAHEVNQLVVARTVHGTVAIEGSSLTEEEAREIVAEPESSAPPGRERERKEAQAAQKAHEYVRDRWGKDRDLPITESDIREIHRLLTADIDYDGNTPGEYRRHPVRVGSPRHGGIYRPPEGHEVIRGLMQDFVDWLNSRAMVEGEPGPVYAILAHYFLVLIHPFGDGNGRTARAVESLILYKGGYNVKGFYSLANFYYRHRDDYFTLLQRTRTELGGEQTQLLRFGLQGLSEELRYIESVVVARLKILLFRDYFRELATNGELNPRQVAILEILASGTKADTGITWESYRTMADPVIAGLYARRTQKTLMRDFRRLALKSLVKLQTVDGKTTVRARIETMDTFI